MYGRIAALMLATAASAAGAQNARPTAQYQVVSEVPGGWIWYLNKRSVTPAGTGMYRFWLTGDNRGTGTTRSTMMQVKLSCDQALHIPLHTTSWDARRAIISDTLRGDASANWTRYATSSPVAAARAWVCR
jgi:hypothetical protein